MAVTLKEIEAIPASYPAVPENLSDAAAAVSADMIWARIESYTAHRFTARAVIWTVEGEGDWTPPLTPAMISGAEKWEGGAWVAVTLPEGPFGFDLPGDGPYRITADVGGGDVPAAVSEAFRRLAEYSAEIGKDGMMTGHPSHVSHGVKMGGDIEENYQRAPAWAARALLLSGAADLLRPYRRA